MSNKVRVAIIGVGNCASALVQGVEYYRDAAEDVEIPGLMHATVGGYHISDIEFTAAFDVTAAKVGLDLSQAINAEPNNTIQFAKVPHLGVTVQRGQTFDGLGHYVSQKVTESEDTAVDVVQILKETQTDVLVNYLPVGSEIASNKCADLLSRTFACGELLVNYSAGNWAAISCAQHSDPLGYRRSYGANSDPKARRLIRILKPNR